MSEGQRGRPKKHLQDDHHFKPAIDVVEVVENGPFVQPAIDQQVLVGDTSIAGIVTEIKESGWYLIESDAVLNSPPRNGNPVRLSETPYGEGVIAFWKRERAFANATKRWQEHGVWRDFQTGMKIAFEPKYWKERYV